jgi:LCP family protein required for cell wall assembly
MDKKLNQKKKRTKISIITTVVKVFSIIGIIAWIALYAANYAIGEETPVKTDDNSNIGTTTKKEEVNILFCGINENLTDTMMYIKYNSKTGKIAMLSIPRDTYTDSVYAPGGKGGHKLNCIYNSADKDIKPLLNIVEGYLDVEMDYYVIIDNSIVRKVVDAIGGVEIEVPIRMKYDDPTQDLHIDLKPGLQVLNGSQAEQFIRFRKNNDGTGYAMGDVQRVEVQHKFINKFISTVLSAKNITKIPDLINIVFKGTDTNGTIREALKYTTDIGNIKKDSMYIDTAPGTTDYIYESGANISYFVLDKAKTKQLIKEKFDLSEKTEVTTDTTTNTNTKK